MLKHALIHPRINHVLGLAGHHSTILLADGNFPVGTVRGANAELVSLNLSPGLVTVSQTLRAILSAVVVDDVHGMGMPVDDSYAQAGEPPIWREYREILGEAGIVGGLQFIEKWNFYEKVKSADHILTIQTGDQALWANLILTVGCRVS